MNGAKYRLAGDGGNSAITNRGRGEASDRQIVKACLTKKLTFLCYAEQPFAEPILGS
jgi:hypothetical protein